MCWMTFVLIFHAACHAASALRYAPLMLCIGNRTLITTKRIAKSSLITRNACRRTVLRHQTSSSQVQRLAVVRELNRKVEVSFLHQGDGVLKIVA